jgi:glycerophosphoryl diester phosphodiesterase
MRRSTISSIVAAVVVGLGLLVVPGRADAVTVSPYPVGHRGGAGGRYVENTMKAFTAGGAAGTWLESDIRFTKDDVPVMLHDETVDRTTNGRGLISSYTFAQVRAFRTADGQVIPSFAQFVTYLKAYRRKAFIEFKVLPTARQWALVDKAAAEMKNSLITYSMYPAYLTAYRAHGFPTALYERVKSATPAQIRAQGSYYFRQYGAVAASEIAALRALKVNVVLFTPSSTSGWKKSRALGAWGVLTDNAATYAAWRP